MRRLFRSVERFDVEYLLISGQAAILYGAATFSEGVDIWIRPAPETRPGSFAPSQRAGHGCTG